MRESDRIIILNTTKYGEKSVILHCLSRSSGRCGMIVKNASGLSMFFQPLNVLDCEISRNARSSLLYGSSFLSAYPLCGIRNNFAKNAISIFVAEVLFRALREGNVDEGLYNWCVSEILLLDALEEDFANFHIRFLMDFAAQLGYKASAVDLFPFMEDSAATAGAMLSGDFADSMLVGLSGAQRSEICSRLLDYLEAHLETPLHIRSLPILAEIFNTLNAK